MRLTADSAAEALFTFAALFELPKSVFSLPLRCHQPDNFAFAQMARAYEVAMSGTGTDVE
jgi:hypothetical protein